MVVEVPRHEAPDCNLTACRDACRPARPGEMLSIIAPGRWRNHNQQEGE